jgi:diaminopimelate epimerase
MQIINSDGTEAESCGNALRCVSKYIYDRGRGRGTLVSVEALAGVYATEVTPRGSKAELVRVNMGIPALRPASFPAEVEGDGPVIDLPLNTYRGSYSGVLVSTGVPHVVIFVPDLKDIDLEGEGKQIEHNPLFPRGANVNFVEVKRPDYLAVRVWERGAGPTLACGTGACAVLVAAVLTGRSPRRATVALPGGEMIIEWSEHGPVYMTGPAVEVFTGEYL